MFTSSKCEFSELFQLIENHSAHHESLSFLGGKTRGATFSVNEDRCLNYQLHKASIFYTRRS